MRTNIRVVATPFTRGDKVFGCHAKLRMEIPGLERGENAHGPECHSGYIQGDDPMIVGEMAWLRRRLVRWAGAGKLNESLIVTAQVIFESEGREG
jgi:hypothetical protein